MNKHFVLAGFITFSCFVYGCSQSSKNVQAKDDYYVAAFIWPSCHNDPMARENLWPEGIGEWEVIKKGDPRYEGHYQPKQPLWGYEMDNDPKVVEKWIDAATDHGVNVFIYDWYWYNECPFLESALNDGFLKAKNNEKMYFYLMWANHNAYKCSWNHHICEEDDKSVLWDGAVDWKNFQTIVDRVITQYFQKPNYLKIDGQPVFCIYDLYTLLRSFNNSVEETRKALDYFREKAKEAGLPGVHFQINSERYTRYSKTLVEHIKNIEALGINSITMYSDIHEDFREDYMEYSANSVKFREQWDEMLNIPFFPCTAVGWDNTPRFPKNGMKNTAHYNTSPESFATILSKAKKYVDSHPNQPKLMTINAWNEWVEGSYLLPDMKYGFGYLEAVKNVMNGKYDKYILE